MKSKLLIAVLLTATSMTALPVQAGNANAPRLNRLMIAPVSITAEEKPTLLWMREEEKLARDVYLALFAQWNQFEFQRIANSEQRHFDVLGKHIVQFGLEDSASSATGVFNQPELQSLYDQLIFTGSQSYVQALTVGASIEDVDIADLVAAIDAATNPALKRTYGNLLEGSKNHLRAFVSLLRSQGADYTPVHMDPALFDAIVGD